MTVELITGHAGSAHISAADDGWYNVGIVGDGKYVLDTGTQLACNVQSANLVTIGIGDALFEGRHVRISAAENVALDNGAQGVNRNDLICIKYDYDSGTAVESASLEVLKGTASSGTAVDPDIPSGSILEGATAAYMPLWRIPISGITVGDPEKMYGEVLSPLDGVLSKTWDVTQIPNLPASKITSGKFALARIPNIDASMVSSGTLALSRIPNINAERITSGTLSVARGGTGVTGSSSSTISTGVVLQQFGKVCVLTVNRSCALTSAWASVSVGTIPSGSRPITEADGVAVVENTTGKAVQIKVTTAGVATVNAMGGDTLGTQYVHGSVAWICA